MSSLRKKRSEPEDRVLVSGATNIVRLVAGAAIKIGYDLLLYRVFRDLPPPEERHEK